MAENNQLTKENVQTTEALEQMKQFAKAADEILQLVDLTSNSTKTWTVFNKESLRTYLQNPYASSSQSSLRNLSKFLYTLSFPLRRIVNYFASLPDFSAYKVNLDMNLVEDNDEESLLQDYENACRFVRKMNLTLNMFKLLVIAWREGIVYFQPYQDDDGTMLFMPLDSQYCKVSSVGYNGLLHVAFDFTFFLQGCQDRPEMPDILGILKRIAVAVLIVDMVIRRGKEGFYVIQGREVDIKQLHTRIKRNGLEPLLLKGGEGHRRLVLQRGGHQGLRQADRPGVCEHLPACP